MSHPVETTRTGGGLSPCSRQTSTKDPPPKRLLLLLLTTPSAQPRRPNRSFAVPAGVLRPPVRLHPPGPRRLRGRADRVRQPGGRGHAEDAGQPRGPGRQGGNVSETDKTAPCGVVGLRGGGGRGCVCVYTVAYIFSSWGYADSGGRGGEVGGGS